MRLFQTLALVLTQLSIGSLLLTSILPPREIRLSFFTLNSLLAAISAAVALALTKTLLGAAWWDVRFLGVTVIGATAAWGCFRLDKPASGRLFLVVSALLGLLFGLLPMLDATLKARQIHTTAPGFFEASILAGTLLLGVTTVGMILGHWYLLMRRLSFVHLQLFARILLGAAGLRTLVFLSTLTQLHRFDPALAGALLPALWSNPVSLFFFCMRILCGLASPLVLGLMVLRCVQQQANQAATGLLYVTAISVLFGELLAAYLLV